MVSIEVESETIAGDAARQLHGCSHVHCDGRLRATARLPRRPSRLEDTTAPELTIPADYTSECSDELILDDARLRTF